MQAINSRGRALKMLQDILQKREEGMVKFRQMEKNITGNEDLTEAAQIRKLNEISTEKEALTRAAQSRLAELRQGVRQWAKDQGGVLQYTEDGKPVSLTRAEVDFLSGLKYLEPSAEDFKQLAEQIGADRSSSPALRMAVTRAAADHGIEIKGLYRSPSEYESELSGILDAAEIAVAPDNGTPEQISVKTAAQHTVDAAINAPLDATPEITVSPIITDESDLNTAVDVTQPDDTPAASLQDEVQAAKSFGLEDEVQAAIRADAVKTAQSVLFDAKNEAERVAEYE